MTIAEIHKEFNVRVKSMLCGMIGSDSDRPMW